MHPKIQNDIELPESPFPTAREMYLAGMVKQLQREVAYWQYQAGEFNKPPMILGGNPTEVKNDDMTFDHRDLVRVAGVIHYPPDFTGPNFRHQVVCWSQKPGTGHSSKWQASYYLDASHMALASDHELQHIAVEMHGNLAEFLYSSIKGKDL